MAAKKDVRIYPAFFFKDGDGIGVEFPDLPGCVTCADDLPDALDKAKDALGGYIYFAEKDKEKLPEPSEFSTLSVPKGYSCSLIEVRMDIVREEQAGRSISKNVTLPAWLNQMAMEARINFSQALQETLRSRLGV